MARLVASALAASAGALAVGRLAPDLLHVAPWPYILLGCGYAALAVGLLLVGAHASATSSRRSGRAPHAAAASAPSACSRSAASGSRS